MGQRLSALALRSEVEEALPLEVVFSLERDRELGSTYASCWNPRENVQGNAEVVVKALCRTFGSEDARCVYSCKAALSASARARRVISARPEKHSLHHLHSGHNWLPSHKEKARSTPVSLPEYLCELQRYVSSVSEDVHAQTLRDYVRHWINASEQVGTESDVDDLQNLFGSALNYCEPAEDILSLNDEICSEEVTQSFVATLLERSYGRADGAALLQQSADVSETFPASEALLTPLHPNLTPMYGCFETKSGFLFVFKKLPFTLDDIIKFSGGILDNDLRARFTLYQILHVLAFCHARGIAHGDLSPSHVNLDENLWVYLSGWRCHPPTAAIPRSHAYGDAAREVVLRWIHGDLSNLDYLLALNRLAGRRLGDPEYHPIIPWVMDFTCSLGGWRDLTRSKFRLCKGDDQLDFTYRSSTPPHHITESLSELTYAVYMSRRTPKHVLKRVVRANFKANEYPGSIERLFRWSPDECIPQFYTDPAVFRSIHEDMEDLAVPAWATSAADFIEKHRAALESDYVSAHLHHWIDITFGYKLSGKAAVEAKNVTLDSYAGARSEARKHGFVQLFSRPHPRRLVRTAAATASGAHASGLVGSPWNVPGLESFQSSFASPRGTDASALFVDSPALGTAQGRLSFSPMTPAHPQRSALAASADASLASAALKRRASLVATGPHAGGAASDDAASAQSAAPSGSAGSAAPPDPLQDHEVASEFGSHYEELHAQYYPPAALRSPLESAASLDMFAFGCVMVEVYARTPALTPRHAAHMAASGALPPHVLSRLPAGARELVCSLLNATPTQRPTAAAVLRNYSDIFPPSFAELHRFLGILAVLESPVARARFAAVHCGAALGSLPPAVAELAVSSLVPLLRDSAARVTALRFVDALGAALGPARTRTHLLGPLLGVFRAQDDPELQMARVRIHFLRTLLARLGTATFLAHILPCIRDALRLSDAPAACGAASKSLVLLARILSPRIAAAHIVAPLLARHLGRARSDTAVQTLANVALSVGPAQGRALVLDPVLARMSPGGDAALQRDLAALAGTLSTLLPPREACAVFVRDACALFRLLLSPQSPRDVLAAAVRAVVAVCDRTAAVGGADDILRYASQFFAYFDALYALGGGPEAARGEPDGPRGSTPVAVARPDAPPQLLQQYPIELVRDLYVPLCERLGCRAVRSAITNWSLLEALLLERYGVDCKRAAAEWREAHGSPVTPSGPAAAALESDAAGAQQATVPPPADDEYTASVAAAAAHAASQAESASLQRLAHAARGGLRDDGAALPAPAPQTRWLVSTSVIWTVRAHRDAVRTIAVAPRETVLATGARDGIMRVWSLYKERDFLGGGNGIPCHSGAVLTSSMLSDTKGVSSDGSSIAAWDCEALHVVEKAVRTGTSIQTLCALAQERSLCGCADGTVAIWDARTARFHATWRVWNPRPPPSQIATPFKGLETLQKTQERQGVRACRALPGDLVAAGTARGAVSLVDERTGLVLMAWQAHDAPITQMACLGNLLVTAGADKVVRVWDVASDSPLERASIGGLADPATALAVSGSSIAIAAGSRVANANLVAAELGQGERLAVSPERLLSTKGKPEKVDILAAALLPLHRYAIFGGDDGTLRVCE